MKLTHDEINEIYTSNNPNAPRFLKTEGSVAWLEASGKGNALLNWFVVLAEQEDHRHVYLEEHLCRSEDLGDVLTDAKDRLLITRIHVDPRDEVCVRLLREHDGLSTYQSAGKDVLKREMYLHPPEHWPSFRGYNHRAALVNVPELVLANVQGGFERLASDRDRDKILIHADCPQLNQAIRMPIKDAISHPAVKAAIWVHASMCKANWVRPTPEFTPRYRNMRRDSRSTL